MVKVPKCKLIQFSLAVLFEMKSECVQQSSRVKVRDSMCTDLHTALLFHFEDYRLGLANARMLSDNLYAQL